MIIAHINQDFNSFLLFFSEKLQHQNGESSGKVFSVLEDLFGLQKEIKNTT